MQNKDFNIPEIPECEMTPLVKLLLAIIANQSTVISKQSEQISKQAEQIERAKEQIQGLRDSIAVLKGEKGKPKIAKSTLENPDKGKGKNPNEKRPGSVKRSKTAELVFHETICLIPEGVKEGWIFKGYNDFNVQGLVIEPHNIKYRRGRWLTPEGETVIADLPGHVSSHFDSVLISYIQHQYFGCRVTQPLLLSQLHEIGIDISSGQLNDILTENNANFHAEKEEVLQAGLAASEFLQVDDTGGRHKGKNGFSTCIGNDLMTFFASTSSKSRINFLEILRAGHTDYVINEDAVSYMREQGIKKGILASLENASDKLFSNKEEWQKHLLTLGIQNSRQAQIATESALLGSAISHGLSKDMVVLSDDAGQFNILIHALCWIHAERLINKLIGFNDQHHADISSVRNQIWTLYQQLKIYKTSPSEALKLEIQLKFDEIFTQKTSFQTLNLALARLYKNKKELLRVLDYPFIPLHNNACETDVREKVTKRKVSGGTQSELGRRARDTFLSLKCTCRKLKVSFWTYLKDRNAAAKNIPSLASIIMERSTKTA